MALEKETVAIPLTSGISPATRARLLPPQKLLEAQNSQFILDQGPQKRNGHVTHTVKTNVSPPGLGDISLPDSAPVRETYSLQNPNLPASWLYGWGVFGPAQLATTTDPFEVSPQPFVGQLFGSAARDNEVVQWDGHRLFSYAPSQPSNFGETQAGSGATAARGPCCIPHLRAENIGKIADAQLVPDGADNGVARAVAWLSSDGVTGAYSVYDSNNRACLVAAKVLTFLAPKSLRVVCVGPWFHILVSDTTANLLEVRSFHQDNPSAIISRNLGVVDIQFDVKKISETRFLVIKSKAGVITAFVLNADGSTINSFVPALGGFAATTNLPIACEIDQNENIGIIWQTTGAPSTVSFATYNAGGAAITARQTITTVAANRRMTVSPRLIPISAAAPLWDVFVEDLVSTFAQVRTYGVQAGVSATLLATRHRMVLASHAIRVGNRNFVWAASWLTGVIGLQTTWFLCDTAMLPVGKMAYGQANADLGTTLNVLPSINWSAGLDTPFKDRIVFSGTLPYNQRVATNVSTLSPTPNGVFAEPSISFYQLDFLPKLRSGQAGRCTYFAGAQLWAYDGVEVVEGVFHMAPEGVSLALNVGAGSLSAGVYRWRVDCCHKNGQGEEVRSWSIITSPVTAAANDAVTVTTPTMPMTRREDSYFLLFRTEANGTVYYLSSSRNPQSASYVRNNQANASATFVDGQTDAVIRAREYHPANSGGNYLDPLPAPASEIVAAGRDRLWLAGGELSAGEVAPSRLFTTKDTPAFTPALNIQVDRGAEPVTAIGFLGDIAAVFRRTSAYVIESDGPDNSFNGFWPAAHLAIADTGAIGQESLALTTMGLWFQSPAGLRLMNFSGAMDRAAGMDVDPISTLAHFSSAVVVPQYTQVRWYSSDENAPSIVLDYSSNSWSLWTGVTNVGAVFWPVSNLAVLGRGDGYVWTEDDTLFTDAGAPYEHKVRLAWLHGGQLGDFQRVRRIGIFGKATAPMTFRTRFYYDERPFHDEEHFVEILEPDAESHPESQFNTSLWGTVDPNADTEWGTGGAWGDDNNHIEKISSPLWFRDNVFKLRIRPRRQKCSVFSVEFSDMAAPNAGFEPVVVALEIARKKGLDRIPTGV